MDLSKIDPQLRHLIGDDEPAGELSGTPDALDPVGQFIHEQTFGIPAPGAKPAVRSIAQIAKALQNIREDLAIAPTNQKREFYALMAASSELYCSPDSFTYKFLHAAADGNQDGMRAAARDLARENPEVFRAN